MGLSNSKLTANTTYKEVRKWPHPLLGNLTELVSQQGQTFFLKTKCHMDQIAHRQAVQKYKQRRFNKHILQVEKVEETKVEEFCGASFRLQLLLEPFHYDLEYVYNKKTIAKQPFSEDELLQILVACVNGLLFMQDNDVKKYHINKQSIVYSGRDIKILDGGIVDKPHPYYSIMMKQPIQKDVFLAPELLQDLQDNLQPYLAPKTDIFTIGMMLLHLATLESLSYLYDYNTFTLDFGEIERKIAALRYSQFFKEILRTMLHKEEEQRPGLISIQDILGINSRRQTIRMDSYRSLKNNSFREKQTSKSESQQSLRISKQEALRSCKQLPDIQEESQKNSSILSKSLLKSEIGKRSKIFNKQVASHESNKQNEMTPLPKFTSNFYKLAHSIEQSPISRLDIQASPILNKLYERIVFENGSFYEGEVSSSGLMEGNGILHYPSGNVAYSGSWFEGQFSGFGTLHNEHPICLTKEFNYTDFSEIGEYWIRYEGEFQNDCRHGFGTLFLTNGEKFAGCFKNDVIDGYGTYNFSNGRQTNAVWKQNRLEKCQ